MNIFEFLTFVAMVFGAVWGGVKGALYFGVVGGVVGVPIGGVIGIGCAYLLIFLFACILSAYTGDPLFKPKTRA
jgi:hypothetical protein